jgi:hypothetical protein
VVRHFVAFCVWLGVCGGREGLIGGVFGVKLYEEVVVLEEGDCGLKGGACGEGGDVVEVYGRVEGCYV